MGLYRPAKSQRYWYRFKVAGREYRGTTGSCSRREAEIVERRKRAAIEAAHPRRRRSSGHTLVELAGLDIDRAVAEGVDAATRVPTLAHMWAWLVRCMGDLPVETIGAQHVSAYVTTRRARGVRGQTIRRELQCLQRGLSLAYRRGWLAIEPNTTDWPRVRSSSKGRNAGKQHEPDIIRRWLGALHAEARDEATLIVLTALRAAEAKRVRLSWVRQAPPGAGVPALLEVPAEAAKTRSPRTIGLCQAAVDLIRRRAVAPDVPVLSQSDFSRHRATVARRIGYSSTITLRDLRHCHLTWGLAATGDARATLEAAGHSDLRTTERYLHTTLIRTAGVARAVAGVLQGDTAA